MVLYAMWHQPTMTSQLESACNQPTNQTTNQPTDWPTTQPTDRPTNQPTDRPTNQPTDQPTNRLSDRPTNQPTNRHTNQPTNSLTNQPTNRSYLLSHMEKQFSRSRVKLSACLWSWRGSNPVPLTRKRLTWLDTNGQWTKKLGSILQWTTKITSHKCTQ
jgi:hypothetical protein